LENFEVRKMLIRKNSNLNEIYKEFKYYEVMREAISALSEIVKINFNEDDIFYQAGLDNLKALHASIIEFLKCYYSPSDIERKLMELELKEHGLKENLRY